jgi:hypothetical protein
LRCRLLLPWQSVIERLVFRWGRQDAEPRSSARVLLARAWLERLRRGHRARRVLWSALAGVVIRGRSAHEHPDFANDTRRDRSDVRRERPQTQDGHGEEGAEHEGDLERRSSAKTGASTKTGERQTRWHDGRAQEDPCQRAITTLEALFSRSSAEREQRANDAPVSTAS